METDLNVTKLTIPIAPAAAREDLE